MSINRNLPVPLITRYLQSRNVQHNQFGIRLQHCGMPVQWLVADTGEVKSGTHHCGVRACLRCQSRKQRRLFRDSVAWVTEITSVDQSLRFIFLSIGFQNVPVENARTQLKAINRGFKRLINRNSQWPGLGSVTSREFTIADDESIHFNTHSIIAVKPSYFTGEQYLSHQAWSELITDAFCLPYLPSVDIQRVRGNTPEEVKTNFLRTYNYIIKPQDYVSNPETGILLADQLRGTRRISFSGLFREYKKAYCPRKSGRQLLQPDKYLVSFTFEEDYTYVH